MCHQWEELLDWAPRRTAAEEDVEPAESTEAAEPVPARGGQKT